MKICVIGAGYVGLVAATSVERGVAVPLDWEMIRRWEKTVFASPERALVAALAPPERSPASEPGSGENGFPPDSSGVPPDSLDHRRIAP